MPPHGRFVVHSAPGHAHTLFEGHLVDIFAFEPVSGILARRSVLQIGAEAKTKLSRTCRSKKPLKFPIFGVMAPQSFHEPDSANTETQKQKVMSSCESVQ